MVGPRGIAVNHIHDPRKGDTYTLDAHTSVVKRVEPHGVTVENTAPDGRVYGGPVSRPYFERTRRSWVLVTRGA